MNNTVYTGDKNVVNLCKNFKINAAQLSLLNRGLNFIPTKGNNKTLKEQMRFDLQQYHRRLKLAVYFEHKPETQCPPFTPKSQWVPPQGKLPPEVTALIEKDLQYFQNQFKIDWVKQNLHPIEFEALFDLCNNKDIVIKPADKGSAVVLMDREQYLWEGYRQLNDTNYYSKLSKPIYWDTIPLIEKIIQSLHQKKFINLKQKAYLLGDSEPRPRLFYMLPKIHKEPSKWSKPGEIPPGRPIVSDCSSETYRTAEFIDFHLNPLSTKHASYIKDTYDFVDKVKRLHVPVNALLFTMDVDSLYTNIDIAEGIQAIKNIFLRYPNSQRPDKELLQLLEINLTKNDFEFNGQYFLQIKGTAMGKKFAPAYADIFMAEWEVAALASCPKKPTTFYRYLDDIWGIWPHSREDFDNFTNILNNHNPSIKIKSELSETAVNFLDTTTFKGPDFSTKKVLDVKVFFKETDTHALLFKTSFHPKHTYAGLVKSQLLRFHRICTRQQDFRHATKVLFHALSTRGYCRPFLRRVFKTFLQTKPQEVSPLLPVVTTYSPSAVKLVKVIKNNFQKFTEKTQLLQEHRIIAAFRKNKNLQDFLVKAKIKKLSHTRPIRHGEFFQPLYWVRNNHTNDVFPTFKYGNVHSKNCVYLIMCKQCDMQYVGETGNTLMTRFTQHRYNIHRKKNTHTLLVRHFLQHGWDSLKATVLQCNSRWSTAQRRKIERIWIHKLDTLHPMGLNEKGGCPRL